MKWDRFDWRGVQPQPVIGVDEVGRGCLAGPVYAAAVIMDVKSLDQDWTDSKLLSETRRKILAEKVKAECQYGIGFASIEEITRLNILRASLLAMMRAVDALKIKTGHILVDGTFKIPDLIGFEQTPLIKGDLRAAPISAAAILAKVTRDELLKQFAEEFPHYGFEKHKGYSTAAHKAAIKSHGPCSIHRPSFAGVKEYL